MRIRLFTSFEEAMDHGFDVKFDWETKTKLEMEIDQR